jgi:hypothetical protein
MGFEWVLMQFDSNFIRLVTKSEPGAVATGQGINSKMDASIRKSLKELEYSAGRFHHPTRAARAGTPVRSRF